MKKVILIIVGLLLAGIGTGLYLYFKGTTDYSNQKPDFTCTQTSLLQAVDGDTNVLHPMRNRLVLVQDGLVKSIQHDSLLSVIELCPTEGGSSIVCQIDPRHNEDLKSIQAGQPISLKGILTDFTLDTDLGLGNTIQLNYCIVSTPQKQ